MRLPFKVMFWAALAALCLMLSFPYFHSRAQSHGMQFPEESGPVVGISGTDIIWGDSTTHTLKANLNNGSMVGQVAMVLTGTTGSIGGGLLAIGGAATGTATVTGASAGQPCQASATDGTNIAVLGVEVHCDVTSTNTATVTLVAIIALTPPAKTYNVRVTP